MIRPTWFTIGLLSALLAIGVVALAMGRAPAPQPLRDPTVVGEEIGDFYAKLVASMSGAIMASSSPQTVKTHLDRLRGEYIYAFVKLGREREAFAPGDKDACDAVVDTRMKEIPQGQIDTILDYARAHQPKDRALANELRSMLRLEEYANFAQLRAVSPREAARVGAV